MDSPTGVNQSTSETQNSQPIQKSCLESNAASSSDTHRTVKIEGMDPVRQPLASAVTEGGPYASHSNQELLELYSRRQHLFEADLPSVSSLLGEALLQQDEELRTTLQGYTPLLSTEEVDKFSKMNSDLIGNLARIRKAKAIKAAAVIAGTKRGIRRRSTPETLYDRITVDLLRLYNARKEILGVTLPQNLPRNEIRQALVVQDTKLGMMVADYQALLTIDEVESFKDKYSVKQKLENIAIQTPEEKHDANQTIKSKSGRSLPTGSGSDSSQNKTPLKKIKGGNKNPGTSSCNLSMEQSGLPNLQSILPPSRIQGGARHRRNLSMPSTSSGFGVGMSLVPSANMNIVTNTQGQAVLVRRISPGYAQQLSNRPSAGWIRHYRGQGYPGLVQGQLKQHTVNLEDPFLDRVATSQPQPNTPIILSGQPQTYLHAFSMQPMSRVAQGSSSSGRAQVERPASFYDITPIPPRYVNPPALNPAQANVRADSQQHTSYNIFGGTLMAPVLQGFTTVPSPIARLSESQGRPTENSAPLEGRQPWSQGFNLNTAPSSMTQEENIHRHAQYDEDFEAWIDSTGGSGLNDG